ncbi:hypothetical protein CHFL109739_09235 [Chryseobacterium flavum]
MISQESSHKMKIFDFHKTLVYLLHTMLGSEKIEVFKTFVPFVVKNDSMLYFYFLSQIISCFFTLFRDYVTTSLDSVTLFL